MPDESLEPLAPATPTIVSLVPEVVADAPLGNSLPEVSPGAPEAPAPKKRGRKPGTRVIRLKSGHVKVLPPLPASGTEVFTLPAIEPKEKNTRARVLREAFRERLQLEAVWIWDRIKWLGENATKEDHPKVLLLTKLIDKLVPESREQEAPPEGAKPPTIVINNLNRGTARG